MSAPRLFPAKSIRENLALMELHHQYWVDAHHRAYFHVGPQLDVPKLPSHAVPVPWPQLWCGGVPVAGASRARACPWPWQVPGGSALPELSTMSQWPRCPPWGTVEGVQLQG